MILPKLKDIGILDKVRQKYDPLVNNVRPHITLVFPFDSNIEKDEIEKHLKDVLSDFYSFEICLRKITGVNSNGRYLFLNVEEGKKEVINLHNKIYTGILKPYYPKWLKEGEFLPHITLGSFDDEESLKNAIEDTKGIKESFEGIVDEITVEIIDENEDSIIEINIELL